MLSIKPVVGVVDGDVVVLGKARGSKQSKNMVFQKIDEAGGIDFTRPIWVAYSGLSDATARKYIADSLAQAKAAEEATADESAVPDDLPSRRSAPSSAPTSARAASPSPSSHGNRARIVFRALS